MERPGAFVEDVGEGQGQQKPRKLKHEVSGWALPPDGVCKGVGLGTHNLPRFTVSSLGLSAETGIHRAQGARDLDGVASSGQVSVRPNEACMFRVFVLTSKSKI